MINIDINILLALQKFRNGIGAILADFLSKMTFLGETSTVFVIIAVIYWCVSKDFGTYLLMGLNTNRLLNGLLKITACVYRPWIRDARIIPYGDSMTTATGYSFPSGHTTNAATVYGGGAIHKNTPWILRTVLGFIVVLVAFSRLYLGVHTPQDVLVGATVSLIVMWLTLKLMQWVVSNPDKDWLVMCIGIILSVIVATYAALKSYPVDYDKTGNILVDGAKMANDIFKSVGWCTAFLIGWILEKRYVRFSTDISLAQKATRLMIGLLGYYVVNLIFVPLIKAWIPSVTGTVVSCFFQMFYVSFIFPWCFKYLEI